MKKIFKISSIFVAVVFSALFLSACGASSPFSVVGKTFKPARQVEILWEEGATAEEKQEIYDELEVQDDSGIKAMYEQWLANDEAELNGIKFVYEANGIGKLYIGNNAIPQTFYWSQSEDLKVVTNYRDEEKTSKFSDGLGELFYVNGRYGMLLSDSACKLYVMFNAENV